METIHYSITNLQMFSGDVKAVERLKKYLEDIEVIFPVIEDVFGHKWSDGKINIELNDSTGGAKYVKPHIVEMGINNRNIQKEYPENLWGCLFHETHHAFMNSVIYNKIAKKYLNGGCEGEPFNSAFMAMTYLRLSDKGKITEQLYKKFLDKLERGITDEGGRILFKDYFDMFSANTNNFSKFISYLKLSNTAFTVEKSFMHDFEEAKNFLN
jgi:hypothetical protein